MASVRGEQIELRGMPRSLRGFARVEPSAIRTMPELVLDGLRQHAAPIHVQTVPRGRHTELRAVLPNATPPGEYRGTLTLDDRRFPAVLNVEGGVRLSCVPGRIELTYGANRRLREVLSLVNDGNVPAMIEKHYGFGLFASRGLDRAIRSAFEARGASDRSIVDAFSEAAADEYGGLAAASVADGAGPLEPGEMRSVTLSFRFSEKARRGASYFGYLTIENLSLLVLVRNADHAATEAVS